ncbi:non-ribosomal peptide synthetase [Streptomyces arenae]|uniref:non-ribosomal peptide synthetase n=1 Tax=Streptomyces arenae TaxID=29301 RepID=UPI002657D434|nr:non-ribosomal peptide synthetase [Streptomyces arenae]MCG7206624.1 non-ribosomal peptide synthetase [Streptomyces arenae]
MVVELFDIAVTAYGGETAILSPSGDLSYRELADRVSGLADALAGHGVRPGDVIAVEQSPRPASIAALLAVLRLGGVVLPLDPVLPPTRRTAVLAAGRATGLIGADESYDRLPERVPLEDPPADAAYICFTSGSTGEPKGILGRGAGLAHFVTWQRDTFEVGPGDRVGQLTSWAFDVALRDVFLPLVSGAALCLPESRSVDADRVLGFLSRRRVTVLHTVPSLARRWLAGRAPVPLPDLRLTFFAGEQLHGELVRDWRGRIAPRARAVNLYGPSETTLAKFWYEVPEPPSPGPQPVGSPLPGTQAASADGGEVVIRTPYRSYGYLSGPDAFRPGPGGPDDLLYPTGDLGSFDASGVLHLLGRIDDQVKVRGVRLALRAVERALESVPGVVQAGVVDVRDERGEVTLVGHVHVRTSSVTRDSLRRAVTDQLSAAAVPAVLHLGREALPLLPSGKLDRSQLRALAGTPVAAAPASAPPASAASITEVCEQVLGVSPLSPDDNLFDQGADSLFALEIAARLEDVLGTPVPLGLLFEAPTIAEIGALLTAPVGAGPTKAAP